MAENAPSRLCFGEFTLDLQRRGLYRGQERVHLTNKPLEALIFLVAGRGRTIEKDELLKAVWAAAYPNVEDDVLTQAIREIRRALGDDKHNPRFVQTVPREGYRFISPVSFEESDKAVTDAPSSGARRYQPAAEAAAAAEGSTAPPAPVAAGQLEPVGGAVPLHSEFYTLRSADHEFRAAIARRDSIVLVKGARQVGKTSLLARGLQQARAAGAQVVLTDFQNLSAAYLESAEKLLLTLAESFAVQLGLGVFPNQTWNPHLSPGINFELYLQREVLAKVSAPVVWALDEVDRLFTCHFGSEIFGLFRSWHNKRALDPAASWGRFTLAIAYATEAHLFITDLNQSPFNVGTRLLLEDFTLDQVAALNQRYGAPLHDEAEVARYFRLVGGHPYLARRGLYELATRGLALAELEAGADHDEGPFGDHLRRLLVSLTQDAALCEVVRAVLQGQPCPTPESFYRLWSAGLLAGDAARGVRLRCQLYAAYLESHLL